MINRVLGLEVYLIRPNTGKHLLFFKKFVNQCKMFIYPLINRICATDLLGYVPCNALIMSEHGNDCWNRFILLNMCGTNRH
uniref:Uncharacterized protein n=1 Tax=Elaeophora elaphi TaxID=1147741 RepID=A0A0R3RNG0_9BILA